MTQTAKPVSSAAQSTIVFTTLPKSGTEFVSGGIRDATDLIPPWQLRDQNFMNEYLSGYCNRADIFSTGVFVSERLLPQGLLSVMPTGHVVGLHAPATHHNLQALRSAGIRRITVLVRDPRDNTVSWTHHLRQLDPTMRNFNSLIQHLPADYFDWPHARQLAFQVRTFLPAAVSWIESWLGAAATRDAELDIQIVYFDEVKRDSLRLFQRLFAFHGVSCDLSRIRQPKVGERHFRQGEHDTWRTEFCEADCAFADSLIGDRLQVAFDRAAVRHPDFEAATAADRAGDDIAAVRCALSLLRQFGACRPAWALLDRVAARRGITVEPGGANENPFIIPEAALKAIEARLLVPGTTPRVS